MIEYAGRVLAKTSRDGTRHEAIFVSFGPGTGKTSFMISAAEALDEFAFIQTRQRPLVITLTYNAQMSQSITKTARKDASDGQAAALRMLFGALKSMGCKGVRNWSAVLRDLAPMGMHADLWTHIQQKLHSWTNATAAVSTGGRCEPSRRCAPPVRLPPLAHIRARGPSGARCCRRRGCSAWRGK